MSQFVQVKNMLAAALLIFAVAVAPSAMANETVALKNALYGAGYDINNVTPQMDDGTRAALVKFQKDHGLTASGVVDEATKKALGMVAVQVAKANTSGNSSASSASASSSSSAPAETQTQNEEAAEEEEDDGGWSFF